MYTTVADGEHEGQPDGWKPEGGGFSNDSTATYTEMNEYLGRMQMEAADLEMAKDVLTFDENKIPPDLATAESHKDCNRFGFVVPSFDDSTIKMCACCCHSRRETYSLCHPAVTMDYDGPVIPQFFYLSQNLIWLSFLLFALALPIQLWIYLDNCNSQEGGSWKNCQISLPVFLDRK